MPLRRKISRPAPIIPLSVGHACVDVYQGAVAALIPFFVAERAYSYAAVAGLVAAASVLSSIVQPVSGALTDKWSMPWLLPVSTFVAGAGIAAAGVSHSYWLTLTVVAISGLGVAAYHPQAARTARHASRGSHTAMGWFSLGGNLGFAAAPLVVAVVIAVGGLDASPLLVVPALAGVVLCVMAARAGEGEALASVAAIPAARRDDWKSFGALTGAVICRSMVFVGLASFVSLYATQRVANDGAGTVALFVLYAGGAVGTIVGSRLAARLGRIRVVRWSYALTIVAVAGVVLVPGPLLLVFVAMASMGLYVPFSLYITLGQDYLPRRMGTASGVTLGLTVSIGGVASLAVGAIADATSLQVALSPLIVLPAIGWVMLRMLSEPEAVTG